MSMNKIKFYDVYKELCRRLVYTGDEVGDTVEIRNYQFTIDDIEDLSIPRNPSLSYAIGELIWYLKGARDVEFISQFASMWERITDDGCTNNSAYGYVLQKQEGFNQIEKIIELLASDPKSRRAVLNINKANPYVITTNDEPCTIALQFLIREGQLHCTAMMRSNDIYFGTPYDVIYFTTLQKIIADRLGLEYGQYTHNAVSMHCYKRDLDKIEAYSQARRSECVRFFIDHNELLKNINYLYKHATKENIIEFSKALHILKEDNDED